MEYFKYFKNFQEILQNYQASFVLKICRKILE